MSILDKASLIQIPSGYKSTKLYSLKPSNGNGDFTFARASSATRVNSDGLIETAQVVSTTELVTNGDFATDSDWSKGNKWTISGGTANKATGSTSNISQVISGISGKRIQVTFTISNQSGSGGVGASANGSDYTQNSANGTYTEYITPTSDNFYIRASYSFVCSIDNVSVKEVIENDVPRLDYSDGSCASLLLEPQSTNLITHSEDIGSNGFNVIGTSIQSNVTTSPDGTTNADLHKEDSSNGSHFMYKDLNLSSGQTYAISVFAKSNGTNRNLRFADGGVGWSSGFAINFDLTNGTADSGGVIESYGNGWYRCSVVGTTNATTSRLLVYNLLNTATSYQGNGTSGVFLYGLQIEQQSYATSYIPTSGASATRTDESFVADTLSTIIGQTEGCIFIDFVYYEGNRFEIFNASSTADGFLIYRSGTAYNLQVGNGGSYWAITNMVTGLTIGTRYKLAINYKLNDYKVYVNGSQTATNTSIEVPTTNKIISSESSGGNKFTNNINQFMMFDEKLTDAELAALTTI
jgi:hypothetical protein